jgi:hypothetical protein
MEVATTWLSLADLGEEEPSQALPNSFRGATRARAAGAAESTLVLANCRVLDAAAGCYLPGGPHDVRVRSGIIQSISPSSERAPGAVDAAAEEAAVVVLDVAGHVVMPGLCDAHVHCTAVTANLAALQSLSESLVTARWGGWLAGWLAGCCWAGPLSCAGLGWAGRWGKQMLGAPA